MRRRLNIDCGRLKRLPSRKSRIAEPIPPSSFLHWKLLAGWLAIILVDSLADFRFEYLYPVVMFVRSVYDSYKYQGLIFSLLFICLVVYLDLLCWTVMTGPLLFLGASSCVWWEVVRSTDHSLSYTALTLSMLFLYVEVSHRLHNLPLLNISRPFAAHCIGYPVVTMSFLIKHHITHVIRQRQQKRVAEENSFYFDLIQKALPQEETKLSDNGNGRDRTGSGVEDITQGNANSGEQKQKVSPKASSKPAQRPQVAASTKHGRSNSGTKSTDQKASSVTKPDQNLSPGATPPLANGDVVRPSSASKVHLPTGKKQATVKAVPRTEPPALPTDPPTAAEKDKMKAMLDSLQAEFKLERHARMEAEVVITQLELEVKKLQADLHASCLQEEESSSRVDQLVSLERSRKNDLHRLRTESDSLQNKLAKLNSGKQQDQAAISDLEKRLKQESDTRQRLEAELREHRNAVRSLWGEEEVQELKDKLSAREREVDGIRRELRQWEKACDDLRKEVTSYQATIRALEKEKLQLKASLVDETRVKIELFTALSDARRKQQSLVEECHRKGVEITRLHQNLAEIMAIIPASPPTSMAGTPFRPTSVGPSVYPPAPNTS